jgi:hypothetical protein
MTRTRNPKMGGKKIPSFGAEVDHGGHIDPRLHGISSSLCFQKPSLQAKTTCFQEFIKSDFSKWE